MGEDYLTVDTDADPGITENVKADIKTHLSMARDFRILGVICVIIAIYTGIIQTDPAIIMTFVAFAFICFNGYEQNKRTAIEWDVQRQ